MARPACWQPMPHTNAIRAELIGADQARACGLEVRARAPVLAMCRKLVERGFDPETPLQAYRDDVLCLRVRAIGEAAALLVEEYASPRFARLRGWLRLPPD